MWSVGHLAIYLIAYSPYLFYSKESNYSQREGKGQSKTLFIRGFDKFLGEDQIRSSLNEYFGACGEIARISIPKDYESGEPKGFVSPLLIKELICTQDMYHRI